MIALLYILRKFFCKTVPNSIQTQVLYKWTSIVNLTRATTDGDEYTHTPNVVTGNKANHKESYSD